MISGQKQLRSCPTGERAATVERMVLTRSSRKQRHFLRNVFWSKPQFMFTKDDNRRVTSKKRSFPMDSKARMIQEHVRLHFFIDGQNATSLHFSQQTIHKRGELPKRQRAIIGTPRVQFSEVACNTKTTQTMTRE